MNAFDFVLLTMKSNIRAYCSHIYEKQKENKANNSKSGARKNLIRDKSYRTTGDFLESGYFQRP